LEEVGRKPVFLKVIFKRCK